MHYFFEFLRLVRNVWMDRMDGIYKLNDLGFKFEFKGEDNFIIHDTELFSVVDLRKNNKHVHFQEDKLGLTDITFKVVSLERQFESESLETFRKLKNLRNKIFQLEFDQLKKLNNFTANEKRVMSECERLNLKGYSLLRVGEGYYERSLESRINEVKGLTIAQLCKSLLYYNSSVEGSHHYFLIIVQYIRSVDEDLLNNNLTKKLDLQKPARLRLASEKETAEVADFGFNAVPPVGLKNKGLVKIVMDENIFKLGLSEIFLGGGEVLTKLRIKNLFEFARSTGSIRIHLSKAK